jgi:hypothetical protein
MKFKRYPITIISVLLICIFTLSNCSPDDGITPDDPGCQNKTEHYYLSEANKSYIPYTGFDTIKMRNQAGDTLYFIGQGKQPFTTSEFVLHNNPACGSNGVEKIYEAYRIIYTDSLNKKTIQLAHYRYRRDDNNSSFSPNVIEIKYETKFYLIGDYQISKSTAQSYIGGLNINGTNYNDVNKVFISAIDTLNKLFINKQFGILKIQNGIDKTIEIIN